VDRDIYARMNQRFGVMVNNALLSQDESLMLRAYESAQALPSTTTTQHIASTGFIVDGDLFRGNEQILMAFHKDSGSPYAMKLASKSEYDRVKEWKDKTETKTVSKFIVEHTLEDFRNKLFLFMPLYPATLEYAPNLSTDVACKFYSQLVDALECFHGFGFIHNDVKPSNILISTDGNFLLADLGSLSKANERSASTQAYVPIDMWDSKNGRITQKAQVSTDWWMLAMTLYDKACGGPVGEGSKEKTTHELLGCFFPDKSSSFKFVSMKESLLSNLANKLGVVRDNQTRVAQASAGSKCCHCTAVACLGMTCSRCKAAYCSKICQMSDWPNHKLKCKAQKSGGPF
jgi:serine/threonine protein kinase